MSETVPERKWVVAVPDPFGPTAYVTKDGGLAWADGERDSAATFTDGDKETMGLMTGEVWMPVDALKTLRCGELKE